MIEPCPRTRSSCGRSTTSSSWSATPSRRPTTTARPSASRSSRTAGSRPAAAISPATRWSRARPASCSPRRTAPSIAAADHLHTHGDGVRDIAFHVEDADAAFEAAVEARRRAGHPAARRGATSTGGPPRGHQDLRRHHPLVLLVPRLHRPVPARVRRRARSRAQDVGILRVDHMVGNVELGKMDYWADWYSERAGLHALHQLRRQGHLDRVQRAHEHRDDRRLATRSSFRSTSRPPASARARSTSIWTSTAGRACSTSRC